MCSFGKDSLATIILAIENNEPLDRVAYIEVMYDRENGISGEYPEHADFIHNVAIPWIESKGIPVDIISSKKDYKAICNKVKEKGNRIGQKYGVQNHFPCMVNGSMKLDVAKQYIRKLKKEYLVTQYIGIATDEPKRLERLQKPDVTEKVSLLAKYGYTEAMAVELCAKHGLLSPLYERGIKRQGCWFCFNSSMKQYHHIMYNHPHLWEDLRHLYYESESHTLQYDDTFDDIERKVKRWNEKNNQRNLFNFDEKGA